MSGDPDILEVIFANNANVNGNKLRVDTGLKENQALLALRRPLDVFETFSVAF
jgi:hypothetical protein